MGKSGGLHWVTEGAGVAAEATVAEVMPRTATEAKAIPAAMPATRQRRMVRDPVAPDGAVTVERSALSDRADMAALRMRFWLAARGKELRE
jgi:hypothetical protein